jgi:hypothetical protein
MGNLLWSLGNTKSFIVSRTGSHFQVHGLNMGWEESVHKKISLLSPFKAVLPKLNFFRKWKWPTGISEPLRQKGVHNHLELVLIN